MSEIWVADQTAIKCLNENCSAKIKGRISYACGRKALNMEALGESTIDDMVEKGMVKNLVDLFKLSYEDILNLDGFKDKKASKVYAAIQGAIGIEAMRLLNALDIPQIGQSASAKLAEHFGSRIFEVGTLSVNYDELLEVQDIGEESALNFVSFMQENFEYVEELVSIVKPTFTEKEELGNALEGKTLVITGTLTQPRGVYEKLAAAHGAKVSGSISKNTHYLLAGDKAGSKLSKAESLGVEILTEEAFYELIA